MGIDRVRTPDPDLMRFADPIATSVLTVVFPEPPIVRLVLELLRPPSIVKVPPAFTLKVETVSNVIAVLLSPSVLTPPAVKEPFSVIAEASIAVKPPVKAKVPPLAPSVKVPVLLKVTALVMVPEVAFSARLYACAAVFKVVAVNAPLKAIVPVVLVRVTVVALTVLLKVAPPEWVMVSVPTPDTVEPLISAPATPPVTSVRL